MIEITLYGGQIVRALQQCQGIHLPGRMCIQRGREMKGLPIPLIDFLERGAMIWLTVPVGDDQAGFDMGRGREVYPPALLSLAIDLVACVAFLLCERQRI